MIDEKYVVICRINKFSIEFVLKLIYSHYSRFSPYNLHFSHLHTNLSPAKDIDLFGNGWYSSNEKSVER